MTEGDARIKHTKNIARLITFMVGQGYQPMIGKDGLKHMKNSLHYEGLATDIDLYKDGVYLTKSEDHAIFGAYWKSLDPDCCWGGDFKDKDGNHYSTQFGGRQ